MSDKTIRESLDEVLTKYTTTIIMEQAGLNVVDISAKEFEQTKESFLKRIENPWISVKDKLPNPKVGSVLLFSKASGVAEGEFRDNKWLQYRWSAKVTPSHWKQLPQTPEEQ